MISNLNFSSIPGDSAVFRVLRAQPVEHIELIRDLNQFQKS
jgi:hypothetical protein